MNLDQIETPAALVDIDKVEQNISRLQSYLNSHNIANRPHIKTHKIPELAHMQMDAGAVGIACQKLGEAEVMSQAGLKDIFIPYNIMGATKLTRLQQLAQRVRLAVAADSDYTVAGYASIISTLSNELEVIVECDIGGSRCGAQTPQQAADLARTIHRTEGLRFGGLMTYPMNEQLGPFVAETKALLATDRIDVAKVSSGGTPKVWQTHTFPGITEHRAGTYIYGDRMQMQAGALTQEECAFRVATTVISRPTADRGIVDGGSKTFSSDITPALSGYGLIIEYPKAQMYAFNEEHGYVDFSACDQKPDIGERVHVIPNHCCVISNLFNEVIGVRGEQVEVVWPVAARGLLQ